MKRGRATGKTRRTKRNRARPSQLSVLKKMLQSRLNYGFEDTLTQFNANVSAPQITLLNGIAEGVGDSERLGNKISMVSLEYRVYARLGDNQSAPQNWAVYIILDKQPNGALPTAVQMLETAQAAGFPNWSSKDRFKILRAIHGTMNVEAIGQGVFSAPVTGYMKINELVNYSGTSAAIASVQTNSLVMLGIGDLATDDNSKPLVTFSSRLVFTQ